MKVSVFTECHGLAGVGARRGPGTVLSKLINDMAARIRAEASGDPAVGGVRYDCLDVAVSAGAIANADSAQCCYAGSYLSPDTVAHRDDELTPASRSLGAMDNGVVDFGFAEDRGALRGAEPFARGVAPHVVGARGCFP